MSFLVLQSSSWRRESDLLYFIIVASRCHVAVSFLRLFLHVQLVCLQGVIMMFPGHTHLLLYKKVQQRVTIKF